MIIVLINVN